MRKIILVVILCILAAFLLFFSPTEDYSVKDGRIFYPQERPNPKFNLTILQEDANYSLTKISVLNRQTTVYSLLRIPKNTPAPPVAIILPGATVPKEARQNLAVLLQENGWASLAIDERGNGETHLTQTTQEKEFQKFRQGKEVLEAETTLDVLKAYDVLKSFPVNRKKTVIIGESMGGRYAVIAAGIDESIAGVIIISSSGYGLPQGKTPEETAFIKIVDPDNYVSRIRKPILFIHSQNDQVISFAYAQNTFSLANQPKKFVEVNCPHGYCKEMNEYIIDFLKSLK